MANGKWKLLAKEIQPRYEATCLRNRLIFYDSAMRHFLPRIHMRHSTRRCSCPCTFPN